MSDSKQPEPHESSGNLYCRNCKQESDIGVDFTMAFQPIIQARTRTIFAHEALVRGVNNESAGWIFQHIDQHNRYRFDQGCRTRAIEWAAQLNLQTFLSINFMPNAVYQPERCIRTTLETAAKCQFPIKQIIFEITEGEKVEDKVHLREIVDYYRATGFKTAIDDFGAGYAGLNLLADIQVDMIKLDMALIRNIDQDKIRQSIVRGILQVCQDLSIIVIAEGVETYQEFQILWGLGVELFQGYYFAKPVFQGLATFTADQLERLLSAAVEL